MNTEAARAMALAGRLYPSVILHGSEATARQAAALDLARLLLCSQQGDERPCGGCRHCRRIAWPGSSPEVFHPDFHVLERDLKTATSVEATRGFLRAAQISPFEAGAQVFVIASAESLSGEAANALLKALEEPHVRSPRNFLLLAPSQFDLLPTLRSRSLAVFLGGGARIDAERVAEPAAGFGAAVARFRASGSVVELFAAAAVLESVGGWRDLRDRRPWELAGAAVLEASRSPEIETGDRRRMLGLAEDLLNGPVLRVRAIGQQRILEGLVFAWLGGATPSGPAGALGAI